MQDRGRGHPKKFERCMENPIPYIPPRHMQDLMLSSQWRSGGVLDIQSKPWNWNHCHCHGIVDENRFTYTYCDRILVNIMVLHLIWLPYIPMVATYCCFFAAIRTVSPQSQICQHRTRHSTRLAPWTWFWHSALCVATSLHERTAYFCLFFLCEKTDLFICLFVSC